MFLFMIDISFVLLSSSAGLLSIALCSLLSATPFVSPTGRGSYYHRTSPRKGRSHV
jgi:hypothetical protein